MWKTLQGFMGAFPEYARNGFNFATESYGGHYGPVFNTYFLDQNAKNISGAVPINLENVLIGNGWFDPLVQYQVCEFLHFPSQTYAIDGDLAKRFTAAFSSTVTRTYTLYMSNWKHIDTIRRTTITLYSQVIRTTMTRTTIPSKPNGSITSTAQAIVSI
jgi:carboxypeptidase C (cathepsin A)